MIVALKQLLSPHSERFIDLRWFALYIFMLTLRTYTKFLFILSMESEMEFTQKKRKLIDIYIFDSKYCNDVHVQCIVVFCVIARM